MHLALQASGDEAVSKISPWIPALIVVAIVIVIILAVRAVLRHQRKAQSAHSLRFQLQAWTVGLIFAGLLAVVFALPDTVDSNLVFSVVGLVVTGALAISGQSIIANGMAGIMLRIIRNFRPGDFILVGDTQGRVSEMGLFHTEIQSPDSDLITLPNALMVNEPVRVLRSSGTIVSVTIGLGYDLSRHTLKELFINAAEKAGVKDPFVQVLELGDYAVTYRIAGFLAESTSILATRSRMREELLDTLHEAGIEIMSPMFVARREADNAALIPRKIRAKAAIENRPTAEDRVFDKAELAASAEDSRADISLHEEELSRLEALSLEQSGAELKATHQLIEAEREVIEGLTAQVQSLEHARAQDD